MLPDEEFIYFCLYAGLQKKIERFLTSFRLFCQGGPIQIRKFEIEHLRTNSNILIIGKPKTGKSTLVKNILFHHRHVPAGTIMLGSESDACYYNDIVPDIYMGKYNEETVHQIIKCQKDFKHKNLLESSAFLVMDDCVYDIRDENLSCLLRNGGNLNLLFLLTMQYCIDTPLDLRNCFDYIFIMREQIHQYKRKMWEYYAEIFPTFSMFSQVLDAVTENYACLVIDNKCMSNKMEDIVFWYRAEQINVPFRVGSKSFWNMGTALKRD